MKNTLSVLCLVFVWAMSSAVWAEPTGNGLSQVPSTAASSDSVASSKPHRLTIGGYGEAVNNFDNTMSAVVWAEPTGEGPSQVASTASAGSLAQSTSRRSTKGGYGEAVYNFARAMSSSDSVASSKPHRLTIGGYGEAVYNYNFYSSNVFRYTYHDRYADVKGHGRVDLPHAVLMLGYDFGHGWSFGTEIEFEHGGVETAIEIEQGRIRERD